jgi:hypothetical protein
VAHLFLQKRILQAGALKAVSSGLSVFRPTVADWRIAMQVESALGPALQAAYAVMQDYGGKMLVFQNAVPSVGELLDYSHVMCAKGHSLVKSTMPEPLIVPGHNARNLIAGGQGLG